jgi:hypothetical protein
MPCFDFDLRMIRAQMALAAVFRHARRSSAERVAAVAGGAGALAPVGINAADSAVRPGGRIESAVADIFHFAAMALAATIVRCRAAFDNFSEHVVERAHEFGRCGVVAFFELLHFSLMASCTVIRRNNHRNLVAVMVKRRRITCSRLVAGIAVHTFLRVALLFHCSTMPGVDDAWHSMQALPASEIWGRSA